MPVSPQFFFECSSSWESADQTSPVYVSGRFVLGFGNSLAQMASPLLLIEICHPQHRGPVTAIYNCLWNFGALRESFPRAHLYNGRLDADETQVVSSIGWGTAYIPNDWSWRSITLIQIIPSMIQLTFIWWVPESPRYLVSKDRNDEALLVLSKYHAGGNILNTIVQFEYQEIKQTIQMDRNTDTTTSYLDFFRTKGNRWRLAIILSLGVISQYSGNALFSNYMNTIYDGAGITQQKQKLAISTGKTILDLIVTIAAALNVDRFGRRPLFLLSTAGMVVAFACWTATGAIYESSDSTNIQSGYGQLIAIWIVGIFYDIGFSGLLIAYALEILPFQLRAKGMMILNITVQAVLAMGKYVPLQAQPRLSNITNRRLAKRTRLLGTASQSTGTSCCSTQCGTWSSSYSSGSSTSRPRDQHSRRSRVYSTETMRWLMLTFTSSPRASTKILTMIFATFVRLTCHGEVVLRADIILKGVESNWDRYILQPVAHEIDFKEIHFHT